MDEQRPHHWILDDADNPVPARDPMAWARWYEENHARTIVGQDKISGTFVSTVFLGTDHRFGYDPDEPDPILYATMIFGSSHDQYQEYYTTRDEALEGHRRAVRLVTETQ